jgi:NCS2 family nucleobase:cation symporter-2/xanthine permease XanP
MTMLNENIRYEPEESPPHLLSIGLGLQATAILLAPIVVAVAIIMRAADQPESYLAWAVFSAVVIAGAITMLQSARIGRFGSGYILFMGTSPTFLVICVLALEAGGPAMMATLVVASSACYFLLAARLSMLRRVITPLVSGVVIMLLAAMAAPIVFRMLADVPDSTPDVAAPVVAAVTVCAVAPLALRGPRKVQLWAPLIGVVVGCVVSAFWGLYDHESVLDAAWIGLPETEWEGLHLGLDAEFWALLVAFALVSMVSALETVGDGVAVQQVSRRQVRTTDFRVIQGALNADGLGNILSGLAGTVPNTTYSSSIPLIALTGVAARRVGLYAGGLLVVSAFFPKIAALLLAIPAPVVGAYITVFIALVFVEGLKTVAGDGLDQQKTLILGLAFWVGIGFEYKFVFPDLLDGSLGTILGNGMVVGGLVAIILVQFIGLSGRRKRARFELSPTIVPQLDEFLEAFASRIGWGQAATDRLRSAGEEALASLLQDEAALSDGRRLVVGVDLRDGVAEMEFSAVLGDENLEDRLAYLPEEPEIEDEREISFRLLRHYASSVRHQKYHDIDVITVQVEGK